MSDTNFPECSILHGSSDQSRSNRGMGYVTLQLNNLEDLVAAQCGCVSCVLSSVWTHPQSDRYRIVCTKFQVVDSNPKPLAVVTLEGYQNNDGVAQFWQLSPNCGGSLKP